MSRKTAEDRIKNYVNFRSQRTQSIVEWPHCCGAAVRNITEAEAEGESSKKKLGSGQRCLAPSPIPKVHFK